ncbi:hypothetical protein [Pseudonocardia spinosispora]|uniref:hypothetical protein n=1 Tax=Pseudonocardia spinosispora TaxID=103441 RepID=UPI0004156AB4|nr:hypothetical protein [Pseudonocardia spinosispora]
MSSTESPFTGFVRRLVVGEHHCRVLIEVPDIGADAWRRLTADRSLSWRRIPTPRQPGGVPILPRRRRARGKMEPTARADLPVPALVEASGSASGTAAVAKQRVAAHAIAALRTAGLDGDVLGAAGADTGPELFGEDHVWPSSDGVLIFGPAEQEELDRRLAMTASVWSLDTDGLRRPSADERGQRRRRTRIDLGAALCVLPLLLMAVPTVGPWFDGRTWAFLLAAATVCVVLPLLALQAMSHSRPMLGEVRNRAIGLTVGLLVLLLLARLLTSVPVPPVAVTVVAGLIVAVLVPIALRLLPVEVPTRAALWGAPILLAVVAAPVGDLLDGIYLGRLGLHATDVQQTFAQRWLSGAFFGVTVLAGMALAAVLWGVVYQLDAVGRRRVTPPAALVTVLSLVYLAAMLALAAGAAGTRAEAAVGELPGSWGGITPRWVCWSPAGGPTPFAGMALPPTGTAIAWLGDAEGQHALWSPETGGVTIPAQVELRVRDSSGPCR